MQTATPFADLSDRDLLAAVKRLAEEECRATRSLIASLVELDARRLYLGEGCSSLFTYCTQILHLSEHAAYGRITAARAARRFPEILEQLTSGSITLTTVVLLAPHLTPENHRDLLASARHTSKRDVECLIARLRPQPPVPSSVRKLPSSTPRQPAVSESPVRESESSVAAASPSPLPPPQPMPRPALVQALAPERYKIQITVGVETIQKLRRAQDLLRHPIPTGDPAAIVDRALTLLVEHLERTKLSATGHPHARQASVVRSRHIPAAVRRAVWARDEGRCAFVGANGRCTERGFLEFHHIVPYAAGGEATVETIALRCRAHNQYEAEQDFGPRQPVLVRECAGRWAYGYSVRTESAASRTREKRAC
ncbi:MAG TPA: HNH endonuclease signature motif containing protein [Vicinamibacterales bacterium]|nr:HNH endonuclease signature motif containing protein [Vicinamibacterales bacterium]